ncbi:hypothetical protein FFLO_05818 [Filobasidium floriforme]|uniref:DNA-directed RNA polymerases I, II, and III subunit RPABC3 n=1 Tax=Filobasidium floriforme TaxID=5210 RepID=A0A8K0JGK9_9TREE|nr:hypothetical protein FFLO_05818 [Filobasidium floriforme]
MSGRSNILFTDKFQVKEIDKDGKKFDRVSRMTSNPSQRGLSLTLDYANEFIQFKPQEYFTMTLATSLHEDGDDEEVAGGSSGAAGGPDEASKKVTKREMWRGGDEGLAEQYEYVMHGKIYKFDETRSGENSTTAYLSFGGLLMALRGSYRHLQELVIGENVYLLIKH